VTDSATEQFVTRLREAGVRGLACDERSVADLERDLRVQLPAAYRAFLLVAGNGWEPLEGSRYALGDDLAGLQRAGQRIARHAKSILPRDAFVFFVHQGFACRFFLLNDGDDPAVFECVEGTARITRVTPRFSEWLSGEVSRSSEFRERRTGGAD
jgi:hypothetical protein